MACRPSSQLPPSEGSWSSGFAGEKRIARDVEAAGVALAAGATERVDGVTDLDIHESDFFEKGLPACARQATSNSTGP
jgi:hypothetical protein